MVVGALLCSPCVVDSHVYIYDSSCTGLACLPSLDLIRAATAVKAWGPLKAFCLQTSALHPVPLVLIVASSELISSLF